MHDSMTMAAVGSIVKVSGSSIATPFGPPSPGSTPTKMPRISPTIMSASVFHVSSTAKPWRSSVSASIVAALEAEYRFERTFGHDHVERDLEGREHCEREQQSREQRLPPGDPPDEPHEPRDQKEARDIQAEPLRQQAEEKRRREHLQHAPQLIPGYEGLHDPVPLEKRCGQPIERRAGEDEAQIERQVSRLRAVVGPADAAAPIVDAEKRC